MNSEAPADPKAMQPFVEWAAQRFFAWHPIAKRQAPTGVPKVRIYVQGGADGLAYASEWLKREGHEELGNKVLHLSESGR